MPQSNICIRLDDDLKKQFDYLCNELGLTMSAAINMFVKAVVRENRIPLDLSLNIPNAVTKQAIEDVENGISCSVPYKSGNQITKAILDGDDED